MVKKISRPAEICNAKWRKPSEFMPVCDGGNVMLKLVIGGYATMQSYEFLSAERLHSLIEYWIYVPE